MALVPPVTKSRPLDAAAPAVSCPPADDTTPRMLAAGGALALRSCAWNLARTGRDALYLQR